MCKRPRNVDCRVLHPKTKLDATQAEGGTNVAWAPAQHQGHLVYALNTTAPSTRPTWLSTRKGAVRVPSDFHNSSVLFHHFPSLPKSNQIKSGAKSDEVRGSAENNVIFYDFNSIMIHDDDIIVSGPRYNSFLGKNK
ncbi:hypothetical protein KEM48_009479 [Puccinia striiformis f. sp. tritici PST-130]|nr:hypothetical protein KEM48_009479 [Puccinia striiformis f. sp. tritici PST-130]